MSLGGALTRRLSTPLLVLLLILRGLVVVVVWVWRQPFALGGLVLAAFVVWQPGPAILAAAGLTLGVVVIVSAWSWLGPDSFANRLVGPVRSLRRRRFYGRRWDEAMSGCGLVRADVVPVLMSVRAGATVDALSAHMAPGSLVTDWRDAAPRIAAALEVRSVRVRRDGPRDVLLLVRHAAVSWQENDAEVDAEVDEVAGQLPEHESNEQLAERIVEQLPEPTQMPGAAFPRRPR